MSKERLTDYISKQKIYDYIKAQINPYGKPFDGTAYEFGLKIMDYIKNSSCDEEVEKLKQYRDLEEQGLLLRLPCHCKDCKHVDYIGCAGNTCYCMKNGAFMQEDDFCKYAEKEEAEEKLRESEGK